jgi:hypothetical protein
VNRALLPVLMAAFLLVSGCGPASKVEEEHPTPASISKIAEPSPVRSSGQKPALSEYPLSDFERANEETVRLEPMVFDDLPAEIIQELERRGCTIPQVYSDRGHGNVVRGQFTVTGQTDTAVLCSRERVSSILVFRKGSAADIAELAPAPDFDYLQTVGDGKIGYSRALGVANARYIQAHYQAYGGLKPPPLDHEGINDCFVEKGSTVWYWHEGKWLSLTGAD